jgi:outer membrane cobalamin receptor
MVRRVTLLLAASLATPLPADDDARSVLYETATVRARPVAGATTAVTVLDRQAIEELGVATVAELMRFIPGVDVASTGPRAGSATAQIRGGEPNFTYVMIDGVPLNDITDQVGGAVNLNGLSTAHVERIELVRGPLSSFFGSTGLAGAINIITRRGTSEAAEVSFELALGDDATTLGSLGVARGGVQGNARLPVGGNELRLTGRLASWDTEDYPEQSGGPRLGDGAIRYSEHDEVSLGVELLVGDADRRHSIRVTAFRHELDRESPFIFNPFTPPASVPDSVEDTTYTSWQLGWTAPEIKAGAGRINLGVDVRVEDGESDSSFPSVPLDISYDIDRTHGGIFAEYRVERGRTTFELGARFDAPEEFDNEVSPRAGVSVRFPNDATRLRASVGRAYKLPSFFALAVPFFGNPDLDPETVVGADLAIEHRTAGGNLFVSLGGFFNRFEDLIDFNDLGFFENVPEVESRGVELAVDWRACERLWIRANATNQDFDEGAAGDPITQRPEWVGGAHVVWQLAERARWSFDGQWVSEQYDFQVPLDGTELTSGYQLYGSSLVIEAAPGWE